MQQRTIRSEKYVEGIGQHSGLPCQVNLVPAPPDTGIVFKKIHRGKTYPILASIANIHDVDHTLALAWQGSQESTVYSITDLMIAVRTLQIDNLYCFVNGPEIPVFPNGVSHYLEVLRNADHYLQSQLRSVLRVTDTICCSTGDAWAVLKPHDSLRLDVQIACDDTNVNNSLAFHARFDDRFQSIDELISTQTSIVNGYESGRYKAVHEKEEARPLQNELKFRIDDCEHTADSHRGRSETWRAMLSAYGDLSLHGQSSMHAWYSGYKADRSLNTRLLRKLYSQPHAYEIVQESELKVAEA